MADEPQMPTTIEEAEKMGLKRVPAAEAEETKKNYPMTADVKANLMGSLCYNGPCIGGQMQVCYFSNGSHNCDACYWWPC